MSTSSRTIKLQSSNGEEFDVDLEVAMLSQTIKNMEEQFGVQNGEDSDEAIPLQNITSSTLKKVIDWCTYHKDDAIFFEDDDDHRDKRTDDIPEWDKNFLQVDKATLFDLIKAANFLEIKGLLEVTCKTLANMIKGKTVEEIRKTFDIENDFTPEEEEKIREESRWAGISGVKDHGSPNLCRHR